MNTILTRPVTIEEFEALPYAETERMELVRGQIVPKDPIDSQGNPMSPGADHGDIQGLIYLALKLWAKSRDAGYAGYVGVETGYVLDGQLGIVRFPDVSYLAEPSRHAGRYPEGNWRVPPTLAVEVISPSERADDIRAKVLDYLNAGVQMVWTVWPRWREVEVHMADGNRRTYNEDDTLEFPEILSGFSCRVSDFFDVDEPV